MANRGALTFQQRYEYNRAFHVWDHEGYRHLTCHHQSSWYKHDQRSRCWLTSQ